MALMVKILNFYQLRFLEHCYLSSYFLLLYSYLNQTLQVWSYLDWSKSNAWAGVPFHFALHFHLPTFKLSVFCSTIQKITNSHHQIEISILCQHRYHWNCFLTNYVWFCFVIFEFGFPEKHLWLNHDLLLYQIHKIQNH